jgi:hypothetical protein
MERCKLLMCTGLILAALSWGAGQVGAQTAATAPQQPPGQITVIEEKPGTITVMDAAGRTHTLMPMRSITPAQRKAAAERFKADRAADAALKAHKGLPSQGEVTK